MIEWIAFAIALIGSGAAAYFDLKTGFIPDELTHGMMALGAILLFFMLPLEQAAFHLVIAGAVFALGALLYTFGQIGGGDVKWFTALALLVPRPPELTLVQQVSSPYPFVVSVFFLAAVLSVLFVSTNYTAKLYHDRRSIKAFQRKLAQGILYCALLVPLFYIWFLINPRMLVIAVPMFFGAFVLAFKNDILQKYVVIKKKVSELTDDDVLALELLDEKTKKALGLWKRKTFLKSELPALKKRARAHGIEKILVNEFLPKFGPFIFASIVLNVVFGDVFLWLLLL